MGWNYLSIPILQRLHHGGRGKMAAIFQTTFSNAFSWMKFFEFWLKFHWNLFKGAFNNIPALAKIIAWHRPGDKPLSEPMLVSLLAHTCVTRPQWTQVLQISVVHNTHFSSDMNTSPMMTICQCGSPPGANSGEISIQMQILVSKEMLLKLTNTKCHPFYLDINVFRCDARVKCTNFFLYINTCL